MQITTVAILVAALAQAGPIPVDNQDVATRAAGPAATPSPSTTISLADAPPTVINATSRAAAVFGTIDLNNTAVLNALGQLDLSGDSVVLRDLDQDNNKDNDEMTPRQRSFLKRTALARSILYPRLALKKGFFWPWFWPFPRLYAPPVYVAPTVVGSPVVLAQAGEPKTAVGGNAVVAKPAAPAVVATNAPAVVPATGVATLALPGVGVNVGVGGGGVGVGVNAGPVGVGVNASAGGVGVKVGEATPSVNTKLAPAVPASAPAGGAPAQAQPAARQA